MIDKIIIDGVNVAGCDRHCSDNHNIPNRCYSDINESYRDCKPKEYQCNFYVTRLEQEKLLLEEEYKILEDNFNSATRDCNERIEKLEQENKELKTEKLYRGIDKQFIEDANDKLYWENKKYRSALEEIRNLCNKGAGVYTNAKVVGLINEVLE